MPRKGSSPDSPSGRAELAQKESRPRMREAVKQPKKPVENTGRRPKEIDFALLEECAELGMTQRAICNAIGISETAWGYFAQKYPNFIEAFERGRRKGQRRRLESLKTLENNGNLGAIIFGLKAIDGFRENVIFTHTGDPSNPIAHEHRHLHLTDVEIGNRIRELMAKSDEARLIDTTKVPDDPPRRLPRNSEDA